MNPLMLFWLLGILNDENEDGDSYIPPVSDSFMARMPAWGAVLLGILLGLLPLGIGILLVHLT